MTIYLDASVVVPLIVAETETERVIAFVDRHSNDLSISGFGIGEVFSALSRLTRTGRLSASLARASLVGFDAWRGDHTKGVSIDDADIAAAAALVRIFSLKLRMPDALHLALCIRHGHALATFDDRLARAARKSGVEVLIPGATDVAS